MNDSRATHRLVGTPALLVDEAILETNLRATAQLAREAGVALRPHWKTHKCPEISRRQIGLGAVGGTVAKTGEAEVFLEAGFGDLVVATPVVDPAKIERLLEAAGRRDAVVCPIIESATGRERWSAAASRLGLEVPVLLEVDVGMGRTGVPAGEAAVPLARAIAESPGLALRGVLTHAGHVYAASSSGEIAAIGRAEGETLVATAESLRNAGIACEVVSVGSTPTAAYSARVRGVTEIRPGNSVFHDAIQVALGVVPEERCALTVLATVVARPAPGRIVLDCGSKTLSSDAGVGGGRIAGFGRVLGRSGLVITRLSEEHGIMEEDGSGVGPERDRASREVANGLTIGETVRILPNHACATTNLHRSLVLVRDGEPIARWEIAAGGRVD